MSAIAALLPLIEIVIFSLGIFVLLRCHPKPYRVATALSLGIMSGLCLLSFLFQLCFLAELPEAAPFLEVVILAGMIRLIWQQRATVDDIRQAAIAIWKATPVTTGVFAIALTYLFTQAMLLPPSSWDALTYHLPRVLLWEQNRTLFLRNFTISPLATFPVGSDILFHAFLRFQTDYGLGLFSWLSYVVILLGTYALTRPAVSRSIALTTAVAIACLPEIVYQSTGTKNDIMLAAVALVCVLWAERWLRIPSPEALFGLGLTLCFGVAVKTSFVLFAAFFLPLWFGLVIQRRQFFLLVQMIVRQRQVVLLAIIPGLILSQGWLFWDNYQQFGDWLGPAEFAYQNQNNDGVLGGIANVVRYGFHSIHLLQPVDEALKGLTGASIPSGLQSIYDSSFAPLFGQAGVAEFVRNQPFEIQWQPQEDTSWFGPISLFLVGPAVAWCLVKDRKLPQIMALVAVGLFLAISYKIGWSPWKARFFTLVYVCTGLCVAAFLAQLQPKSWVMKGIRWLSLVILVYACLYNFSKPMIPSSFYLGRENIWLRSDWTRDRLVYDHLYRGERSQRIGQVIDSADTVLITGYDHYFSLLFHNPGINFVLQATEANVEGALSLATVQEQLIEADYLICFAQPCDPTSTDIPLSLEWNDNNFGGIPEVYEIRKQKNTG
ncbi:hypothetical protein PN498_03600 [Oscillatoria sp. CS-180]|uniref:hypothetical protein n=1 Tax=Oscillatoria sp. CS-180 TaxID=3021720 RepID=UPI00232D20B1|nr:hypothetical protein [Oscillatoria sp. CS-180]MDB9525059.1 hypothetical protein [Oscillatoria sp. CS-180]